MIRKVIGLLLAICCVITSHAQTKKMGHRKSRFPKNDYYNKKDPSLLQNIDNLKADSVKIYSFTCGQAIKPPKGIILKVVEGEQMAPHLLVDSTQHWAFTLADSGKVVKPIDIKTILRCLKYSYKDEYGDDPLGCYEPRMGIMFFKDGIVQAHIDICLQCGRIAFEKFKKEHVSYSYEWIIIGTKMREYFNSLCVNYNLLCCRGE